MYVRFNLSMIIFLVFVVSSEALSQTYFIQKYAIDEGLPTRSIYGVTQDRDGKMWFATYEGVSSYDGFTWTNYNSKSKLPHASYRNILCDEKGMIWAFPFYSKDTICYFDGLKWNRIKNTFYQGDGILINSAFVIYNENIPVIHLGTSVGLFNYVNNEWREIPFTQNVKGKFIHCISLKDGSIYIGTKEGVYIYKDGKIDESLNKYLPLHSRTILGFEFDKDKIWINGRNWLGYFSNNTFTEVKNGFLLPAVKMIEPSFMEIDVNGVIYFGNIWFKYVYYHNTNELNPLQRDNGFSANGGTSLYIDRENNVWLTDTRGVDKINNSYIRNYGRINGLLENEVTASCEWKKNVIVFGHNKGISILSDKGIKSYDFSQKGKYTTRVSDIIVTDKKEIIFAASELGLGKIDNNGKLVWINTAVNPPVTSVIQDNKGRIWFSSNYGIHYMDGNNIRNFEPETDQKIYFRKFFKQKDGTIVIAGNGGLSYIKDNKFYTITSDILKGNDVFAYLKTKSGSEFAGTMSGLCIVKDGKLIKHTDYGFSISSPVYFILEDYDGFLWFGTNDGVIKWNGKDQINYFNTKNGLAGNETNRSAAIIDSNNKIWIGTDLGLTCFLPGINNLKVPIPVISLLGCEDFDANKYDLKHKISVNYISNTLVFNFRGMSFFNEKYLMYKIKLEGYDADWQIVSQSMLNNIKYSRLLPGDYKFYISARNYSGQWSDIVSSDLIVVEVPFYRSYWFFLLVVLLIFSFVFLFNKIYYQKKHNIQLKNEILERKKVEQALIESKERYMDLVNLLPETIFETDIDGKITFLNKSGMKLLNYNEEDISEGIIFNKIIIVDESEEFNGNHFNISFEVSRENNLFAISKDGMNFPVILNSVPIIKDGVIVGTRGILIDITELKKFESTLKRYAKELEELNSNKDKFFSIIAHDLKNPFQGLLGFTEILSSDFDSMSPVELKEAISHITESSRTAYRILENLLHWSRMQTGRIINNPENVNLKSVSLNVVELLSAGIIRKNISIINNIGDDIIVFVDKNMVTSIFQNLISNAVKFSYPGKEIILHSIPEEEYVEVSIKDFGVGISRDDLNKLFAIDKQVSKPGTLDERGTGLGLILCKEMIEISGGTIKVESEEGKGSCFTITFPLSE